MSVALSTPAGQLRDRRDSRPAPLRRKRVPPTPSNSSRRRRVVNTLLVFATIVLFVDALVGDKGVVERVRARHEYEREAATLEGIRRENQAMRDQIQRLKDDPAAIESIAREELGLIRPGELLFILREPQKPASYQPSPQ
jgi:cell division protein FtsB